VAEQEKDVLEDFLTQEEITGLDDHVDIDLNPVFMFHIKKAKEAARLEKRLAELAAEGLTEDEIAERMEADDAPVGEGRMNPLQLLISVGARVEPVKGKTSEEFLKKTEIRRKQRNIAVYLQKTFGIDTKMVAAKEAKGGPTGGRKNALQIANETKSKPVGGPTYEREVTQVKHAKSARLVYRAYKREQDAQKKRKQKPRESGRQSTLDNPLDMSQPVEGRRAGGVLNASDLVGLLAEDGDDDIENDPDDGYDEGDVDYGDFDGEEDFDNDEYFEEFDDVSA
jgi:hypothetical protein